MSTSIRPAFFLVVAAILMGAAAPLPSFWSQAPTEAETKTAMEAAGVKPGATGRAVVTCKIKPDGSLEACRIPLENPPGAGYAKGLLSLTPQYRVDMMRPYAPKAGGEASIAAGSYDADVRPDWLRKPTYEDLVAVWPAKALAAGRGGRAVINCLVSLQGALFDCVVISEAPQEDHFGDAVLVLAPQLLMKPGTLKGRPVVSSVSVPFVFALQKGSSPPEPFEPAKGVVGASMAWPKAPDYAAVAAAYPGKARTAKIGGRATLICEFAKDGRLKNCDTLSEEPKHEGFGGAAKQLAGQFQAFPTLTDGHNIAGATVRLPFVFDPAMLTDSPPVIGKAQWASLPSEQDTSAAFGGVAVNGEARARLACVVVQGGLVTQCRVEEEAPAGVGIGQAALTLSPHFRLTTWTAEGLPTVGGTVGIPIRYKLKESGSTPNG